MLIAQILGMVPLAAILLPFVMNTEGRVKDVLTAIQTLLLVVQAVAFITYLVMAGI